MHMANYLKSVMGLVWRLDGKLVSQVTVPK